MKHQKERMIACLCVLGFLLCGCAPIQSGRPEVLYLPEGNRWAAYEVADRDYGGRLLLLRREALPERVAFGAEDTAYYPQSGVDAFLSTEFLDLFPDWVQAELCDTQIEVCRKFPDNSQTEFITRKAFLLSATEAGIEMDIVTKEGSPLSFFRDRSRHCIRDDDGAETGWWLRSTYTSDRGLAWHIQANGTLGGRTVRQPSGIRPAVCVEPEIPCEYREDLGGYGLKQP